MEAPWEHQQPNSHRQIEIGPESQQFSSIHLAHPVGNQQLSTQIEQNQLASKNLLPKQNENLNHQQTRSNGPQSTSTLPSGKLSGWPKSDSAAGSHSIPGIPSAKPAEADPVEINISQNSSKNLSLKQNQIQEPQVKEQKQEEKNLIFEKPKEEKKPAHNLTASKPLKLDLPQNHNETNAKDIKEDQVKDQQMMEKSEAQLPKQNEIEVEEVRGREPPRQAEAAHATDRQDRDSSDTVQNQINLASAGNAKAIKKQKQAPKQDNAKDIQKQNPGDKKLIIKNRAPAQDKQPVKHLDPAPDEYGINNLAPAEVNPVEKILSPAEVAQEVKDVQDSNQEAPLLKNLIYKKEENQVQGSVYAKTAKRSTKLANKSAATKSNQQQPKQKANASSQPLIKNQKQQKASKPVLEVVQTNLQHEIFIEYDRSKYNQDLQEDLQAEKFEILRLEIKNNIELPVIDVDGVRDELAKEKQDASIRRPTQPPRQKVKSAVDTEKKDKQTRAGSQNVNKKNESPRLEEQKQENKSRRSSQSGQVKPDTLQVNKDANNENSGRSPSSNRSLSIQSPNPAPQKGTLSIVNTKARQGVKPKKPNEIQAHQNIEARTKQLELINKNKINNKEEDSTKLRVSADNNEVKDGKLVAITIENVKSTASNIKESEQKKSDEKKENVEQDGQAAKHMGVTDEFEVSQSLMPKQAIPKQKKKKTENVVEKIDGEAAQIQENKSKSNKNDSRRNSKKSADSQLSKIKKADDIDKKEKQDSQRQIQSKIQSPSAGTSVKIQLKNQQIKNNQQNKPKQNKQSTQQPDRANDPSKARTRNFETIKKDSKHSSGSKRQSKSPIKDENQFKPKEKSQEKQKHENKKAAAKKEKGGGGNNDNKEKKKKKKKEKKEENQQAESHDNITLIDLKLEVGGGNDATSKNESPLLTEIKTKSLRSNEKVAMMNFTNNQQPPFIAEIMDEHCRLTQKIQLFDKSLMNQRTYTQYSQTQTDGPPNSAQKIENQSTQKISLQKSNLMENEQNKSQIAPFSLQDNEKNHEDDQVYQLNQQELEKIQEGLNENINEKEEEHGEGDAGSAADAGDATEDPEDQEEAKDVQEENSSDGSSEAQEEPSVQSEKYTEFEQSNKENQTQSNSKSNSNDKIEDNYTLQQDSVKEQSIDQEVEVPVPQEIPQTFGETNADERMNESEIKDQEEEQKDVIREVTTEVTKSDGKGTQSKEDQVQISIHSDQNSANNGQNNDYQQRLDYFLNKSCSMPTEGQIDQYHQQGAYIRLKSALVITSIDGAILKQQEEFDQINEAIQQIQPMQEFEASAPQMPIDPVGRNSVEWEEEKEMANKAKQMKRTEESDSGHAAVEQDDIINSDIEDEEVDEQIINQDTQLNTPRLPPQKKGRESQEPSPIPTDAMASLSSRQLDQAAMQQPSAEVQQEEIKEETAIQQQTQINESISEEQASEIAQQVLSQEVDQQEEQEKKQQNEMINTEIDCNNNTTEDSPIHEEFNVQQFNSKSEEGPKESVKAERGPPVPPQNQDQPQSQQSQVQRVRDNMRFKGFELKESKIIRGINYNVEDLDPSSNLNQDTASAPPPNQQNTTNRQLSSNSMVNFVNEETSEDQTVIAEDDDQQNSTERVIDSTARPPGNNEDEENGNKYDIFSVQGGWRKADSSKDNDYDAEQQDQHSDAIGQNDFEMKQNEQEIENMKQKYNSIDPKLTSDFDKSGGSRDDIFHLFQASQQSKDYQIRQSQSSGNRTAMSGEQNISPIESTSPINQGSIIDGDDARYQRSAERASTHSNVEESSKRRKVAYEDPDGENEEYINSLLKETQAVMQKKGKKKAKNFVQQKFRHFNQFNVNEIFNTITKRNNNSKLLAKKVKKAGKSEGAAGLQYDNLLKPDENVQNIENEQQSLSNNSHQPGNYYDVFSDDEDENVYEKKQHERIYGVDPKDKRFASSRARKVYVVKQFYNKLEATSRLGITKFKANKEWELPAPQNLNQSQDHDTSKQALLGGASFDQSFSGSSHGQQDKQEPNTLRNEEDRKHKKPPQEFEWNRFLRKFVIMPTNNFYAIWCFVRLLFSILEGVIFPYGAAQGYREVDKRLWSILILSQIIFAVDMILNFFTAVRNEGDEETYITNLQQIGRIYLAGQFKQHVLLLFPLGYIGEMIQPNLRFLYLIKAIRIYEFLNILKPTFYMPIIRTVYYNKLQKVLSDESKKDDMDESNNLILERQRAQNYVHSIRILCYILSFGYFIGTFWSLLVNQYLRNHEERDEEEFVNHFEIDKMSAAENQVIQIYYCFTTLTTVGFGDFHPISNQERFICAFMMFFGVLTLSYIGEAFYDMMERLKAFEKDYEETSGLHKFLMVLRKYNYSQRLPPKFENKILDFFDYKWKTDVGYCIRTNEDMALLHQLPSETQMRIIKDYLYHDFLRDFSRLFRFKQNKFHTRILEKYKQYPYYTYNDQEYEKFILNMVIQLEPRYFAPKTIIYQELDESLELYFVLRGRYDIGYELNKKQYYRLRAASKTVIGIYNLQTGQRSQYLFKSLTALHCYAIRKANWKQLMANFPRFSQQLSTVAVYNYEKNIRKPMTKKKEEHILKLQKRKDFDHIYCLHDFQDQEYDQIRIGALRHKLGAGEGFRRSKSRKSDRMVFREASSIEQNLQECTFMLQNCILPKMGRILQFALSHKVAQAVGETYAQRLSAIEARRPSNT